MNDLSENTQLVEDTGDINDRTDTRAGSCGNNKIDTSNTADSNVLNAAWTIRTMLNQMVASPSPSTSTAISSPQKTIDDRDDSGIRRSDLPSSAAPASISSSHQKDYYERLKTYTIMEYFAKPIHLSPIICAITGWELQQKQQSTTSTIKKMKSPRNVNTSSNIPNILSLSENMNAPTTSFIDSVSRLVCPCCRKVLVIYIPQSILSKESIDSLIRQYQHQLYEKHELYCKYRTSAEYIINKAFVRYTTDNNTISNRNSNRVSNTMQQYQSKLIVPTVLSRAIQQQIIHSSSTNDNSMGNNNISSSIMLSSLELVEQTSPWWIIALKFKQLFPYIRNILVQNPSITIVVPNDVLYYDKDNHNNDDAEAGDNNNNSNSNGGNNEASKEKDTSSTLFNRLVCMLQQRNVTTNGDNDDDNNDSNITAVNTLIELPTISSLIEWKAAEITMAILIIGWDLKAAPVTSSTDTTTAIHCTFCLSCQPIIPTIKPQFDNVEILDLLLTKKRKRQNTTTTSLFSEWNQPCTAHRYYCPWVCGFPITAKPNKDSRNDEIVLTTTVPLWQIVTERLLQETKQSYTKSKSNEQLHPNEVSYTNVLHIHQQLQNSISPKLSIITKRKKNFVN